jgi:hypothetical protein
MVRNGVGALELIEESANRLEVLRRLFDAEAARAEPSRRAVELAAEVRQLEGQLAKLGVRLPAPSTPSITMSTRAA